MVVQADQVVRVVRAVRVVQVFIKVFKVVQGCQDGQGGQGLRVGRVIRVARVWVVQVVSLEDMHSENMGFTWSKPSNYRKNWRCHACEGRTYGHVKERQYSALAEFAINAI